MPHECTNCGHMFPDGSKEMLSGCPDCGGNKFQFAPNATAARGSSERAGNAGTTDRPRSTERAGPDAGSEDADGVATRAAETVRDLVSSDSSDAARSGTERTDGPTDASGSWPTTDTGSSVAGDTDPNTNSSGAEEFSEWPDTARRPEDRSSRTETSDSSVTDPSAPADRSASADPSLSAESTSFADDEDTAQADARSEVVSRDDLPSDSVHSGNGTSGGESDRPSRSADDEDAPPDHGRVVSEPSADRPSIEDLREELNEQFESIKILNPGQYELNLMELYNREEYIISLQEDGRYVIDVPDSWRGGDSE
ncbi:OapC/ArvC family zinc-ribbon domain-containing protein [Halosolutus halophilus]|uniref:OapC/ArvC family zinc-ribbon domain-containing protein n=1 Tax=Halosolutus halophilus TaxID=1552990 RepID=UPI0022351CC0|nr:Zn-ribbon containing protein [Halosolutus halophilus]